MRKQLRDAHLIGSFLAIAAVVDVDASCATSSTTGERGESVEGPNNASSRCPSHVFDTEPVREDPSDAIGCYEVLEQKGGLGPFVNVGDLVLKKIPVDDLGDFLKLVRCGERRGGDFVDVPCPDVVAQRGAFEVGGAFPISTIHEEYRTPLSSPLPWQLKPHWSRLPDGGLVLAEDLGDVFACFTKTHDGFSGWTRTFNDHLGNPARLVTRECAATASDADATDGESRTTEPSDELTPWGASMRACFGAHELYTEVRESLGCFEMQIAPAPGGAPGKSGLLILRAEPVALDWIRRGRTCFVSRAGQLERVECPLFASAIEHVANANLLMLDDRHPREAGDWATTKDGHLMLAVGYGFVGAGACLAATPSGFVGRVAQWTDSGPPEYDFRDITLTRIGCPARP